MTLPYSLCKELKDSGYPQHFNDEIYCSETGGLANWSTIDIQWSCCSDASKNHVDIPSLSDLIEKCGDQFGWLYPAYPYSDKPSQVNWWVDRYNQVGIQNEFGGETPEEAVAKLWLALHK